LRALSLRRVEAHALLEPPLLVDQPSVAQPPKVAAQPLPPRTPRNRSTESGVTTVTTSGSTSGSPPRVFLPDRQSLTSQTDTRTPPPRKDRFLVPLYRQQFLELLSGSR